MESASPTQSPLQLGSNMFLRFLTFAENTSSGLQCNFINVLPLLLNEDSLILFPFLLVDIFLFKILSGFISFFFFYNRISFIFKKIFID